MIDGKPFTDVLGEMTGAVGTATGITPYLGRR
jgi:hypothetical protein